MTFLELAKKRYSARGYIGKPVEKEKLIQILEAGRVAPSACNLQPLYLIVVQDEAKRVEIASTYYRKWLIQSPVIIVICGDHSISWRRADSKDHCDIDAAIAIDHLTLAATELGLVTCWICQFDSMKCHEILNLPRHIEIVALLPLGYPVDESNPNRHDSNRKPFDKLVFWNEFDK